MCASTVTWISIALNHAHARSAASPSDPFSRFCGPCDAVSLHPVTRSKRRREERRNLVMSHLIIKTIKGHLTRASLHVPRPGCNPWLQKGALGPRRSLVGRSSRHGGESWDAERTRDDHMGIAALITVVVGCNDHEYVGLGRLLWFWSARGENTKSLSANREDIG